MNESQEWSSCSQPTKGDILKWNEPLWATPNKPRGKPDKIGEQEIIAQLVGTQDVLEFKVISVRKTSPGQESPLKVKENDNIKRKKSTIEKGGCQKLSICKSSRIQP